MYNLSDSCDYDGLSLPLPMTRLGRGAGSKGWALQRASRRLGAGEVPIFRV